MMTQTSNQETQMSLHTILALLCMLMIFALAWALPIKIEEPVIYDRLNPPTTQEAKPTFVTPETKRLWAKILLRADSIIENVSSR